MLCCGCCGKDLLSRWSQLVCESVLVPGVGDAGGLDLECVLKLRLKCRNKIRILVAGCDAMVSIRFVPHQMFRTHVPIASQANEKIKKQ